MSAPARDSDAEADGSTLPIFSRTSLARQDGDRRPALVACRGLVYDVSASPEWRGGLHRGLHWAGQDLTDQLAEAPHGIEALIGHPVVGRYREPDERSSEGR